jgi:eukaryotic-like serine/threonine-protein kinase
VNKGSQSDMTGRVIRGKYAIEGVIGRGGMGLVYRARNVQLGNPVAVKFMLPEIGEVAQVAERFIREARIAASLQSDHVVRILDVDSDEGIPFMVMELLEGEELSTRLKRHGRLPVQEAVRHIVDVCGALAEAHAKNIVHRDLKPANMFLAKRWSGQEILKVLDFGISKVQTHGGIELTTNGMSLGSPAYMPPEQITSSATVDGRADIWALGVCLYRFLSGTLPFDSENVWEVSFLVTSREPKPLGELCPELSPSLVEIVHRCLAKDVNQRFQTVQDVALALEAVVDVGSGMVAIGLQQPVSERQRTSPLRDLHTPAPVAGYEATRQAAVVPLPVPVPTTTTATTGARMSVSSASVAPEPLEPPSALHRAVPVVIGASAVVSVLCAAGLFFALRVRNTVVEPTPVVAATRVAAPETLPSTAGVQEPAPHNVVPNDVSTAVPTATQHAQSTASTARPTPSTRPTVVRIAPTSRPKSNSSGVIPDGR